MEKAKRARTPSVRIREPSSVLDIAELFTPKAGKYWESKTPVPDAAAPEGVITMQQPKRKRRSASGQKRTRKSTAATTTSRKRAPPKVIPKAQSKPPAKRTKRAAKTTSQDAATVGESGGGDGDAGAGAGDKAAPAVHVEEGVPADVLNHGNSHSSESEDSESDDNGSDSSSASESEVEGPPKQNRQCTNNDVATKLTQLNHEVIRYSQAVSVLQQKHTTDRASLRKRMQDMEEKHDRDIARLVDAKQSTVIDKQSELKELVQQLLTSIEAVQKTGAQLDPVLQQVAQQHAALQQAAQQQQQQ